MLWLGDSSDSLFWNYPWVSVQLRGGGSWKSTSVGLQPEQSRWINYLISLSDLFSAWHLIFWYFRPCSLTFHEVKCKWESSGAGASWLTQHHFRHLFLMRANSDTQKRGMPILLIIGRIVKIPWPKFITTRQVFLGILSFFNQMPSIPLEISTFWRVAAVVLAAVGPSLDTGGTHTLGPCWLSQCLLNLAAASGQYHCCFWLRTIAKPSVSKKKKFYFCVVFC